MTYAEVDNLMRVTRWAIRNWRSHAEYEDILAEAYGKAWKGYQDAVRSGYPQPITWAVRQARWAPAEWHRRNGGQQGQVDLPLNEADQLPESEFEGPLIRQIALRQLIGALLARVTPQQRRLVVRMLLHQENQSRAATALGISGAAASDQIRRVRAAGADLVEEMR